MKHIILRSAIFVLMLSPIGAYGQANEVVSARVDRRVELMSIVARLAGYEEFIRNDFKSYVTDVEDHFTKFRDHPAIEYARKVRRDRSVSYDAVMSMAVHLNQPPALTPRVAFSDLVPDKRWGKSDGENFAKLLAEFYKDAGCEAFFESHDAMYREAEGRFQQLLTKVEFGWYGRFYGEKPAGEFHLLIGLLNGGGNFGPKVVLPDGREDLFAIIGTWRFDDQGAPLYDDRLLPTIIHEYNHSFINPLVYANEKGFRDAGSKIYQPVAGEMKRLAYGTWQTMMLESLVRAAVIRYIIEHDQNEEIRRKRVIDERNIGFLWMEDLVGLLGRYESERKRYLKFRDFMPEVIRFYDGLAPRINGMVADFNSARPSVQSTAPFANGAQDVDPSITEITFTFDRPLEPKGVSINFGPGGPAQFPIVKVIGYGEDGKRLTLQLKMNPATSYEFILTEQSFRTREGFPLKPYTMKFRTRP
ncbi:MAG: DUF4932 domain-containing protein [Blastocatellales bacterium]